MQSQRLPTESQVLEDEVLPGTGTADQPAEEMSERHDHGKNSSGKNPNPAFRQVIRSAGVRRFGEAQVSGFESLLLRQIKELCTSSLPARTRQTQAHALGQKELVSVFGTSSIVSEVLSGKREMNKDHIKRLSARFHVSPELFF